MDLSMQSMHGMSSITPVSMFPGSGYGLATPGTNTSVFSSKPGGASRSSAVAKKPSVSINQAEGGSLVLHTSGWAGVGLVFEDKDDEGFPLVKEVLAYGSAERDGTISTGDSIESVDSNSTKGLSMQELRDAILGPVGSTVTVTVKKSTTSKDITMTRAPVEYWAMLDANQKLKQDLDAMTKKFREAESTLRALKNENDILKKRSDNTDGANEKLRAELMEEKEARKRSEIEGKSLTQEKKQLEEQMEALLKKLSDTTLNFKTAERLARDMTAKARDADQRWKNEESLRNMAEERESKLQAQALDETQKRRELESTLHEQREANHLAEQHIANAAAMKAEMKRLQLAVNAEKAKVVSVDAQHASNTSKMSKHEDTTQKLKDQIERLKKEIEEHKASLDTAKKESKTLEIERKKAQNEADAANKAKTMAEAAAKTEKDRTKSLETRLRDKDSTISGASSARFTLEEQVKRAADGEARAKKAVEEERVKAEKAAQAMKDAQSQAENEKKMYDLKVKGLMSEIDTLQKYISDLSRDLSESSERTNTKVTAMVNQCKDMQKTETASQIKMADLESKLGAALEKEKGTRADLTALEEKYSSMVKEYEEWRDKCKKAEMANDSLKTENGKALEELGAAKKEAQMVKAKEQQTSSERDALKKSEAQTGEKCSEITKKVSELEKQLKAKTLEVQGLTKTVEALEIQMEDAALAKKDNNTFDSKLKGLEHEIKGLEDDKKRLEAANEQQRKDTQKATEKYENLFAEFAKTRADFEGKTNAQIREMREQLYLLLQERDNLQAEVDRYTALPNPCGVGLLMDQTSTTLPSGAIQRGYVVRAMEPGLSADLSGVIERGDELLTVNEVLAEDLELVEMQNLVAGERGSQVAFQFRRYNTDGTSFSFRILLKRGAWGPQHAVMSPEDLDMIDRGSWPEPGSVSASSTNPDNFSRGKPVSMIQLTRVSSSFRRKVAENTSQVPGLLQQPAADEMVPM